MPLVSKTFSELITFTRASTATYFNSAGVLTSAAINEARRDYDPSTLAARGLLIEEARTNRLANSVASGATISSGTATAPNGSAMMKAVCPNGVVSFPSIGGGSGNTQSFSLSSGQAIDVAISGWFAAGTSGITIEPLLVIDFRTNPSLNFLYATLQIDTSNWTVRSKFLPSGVTELQAPSITLFSTGVYRVSWVVRYTQGATVRDGTAAYVQLRDPAGSGTYTGDGVGHFQFYGLQCETGAFPTSYIPTTTTALTRAADVASTPIGTWYNAAEGTLFAQANVISQSYNQGVLADIGAIGTFGTTIYLNWNGTSWTLNPNTPPLNMGSVVTTSSTAKIAAAIKANDSVLSANGLLGGVDTSCTLPSAPVAFSIGKAGWSAGSNFLNGWIQRFVYYPRRLSNAELQAITA